MTAMVMEKFKDTYTRLDRTNLHLIDGLYGEDIYFEDPFHTIKGLKELKKYFQRLYQNVESICFEFNEELSDGEVWVLGWTMHLQHPKLNNGEVYSLQGISRLVIDDEQRVIYHKDYFDGGAMLYERVPVIGAVIRWIKDKL